MSGYFQRLPISMAELKRWEAASLRLNHVPELLLRIYDVRADPSKFQLKRAANVARYVASTTAEPERAVAITLAEELERRAA